MFGNYEKRLTKNGVPVIRKSFFTPLCCHNHFDGKVDLSLKTERRELGIKFVFEKIKFSEKFKQQCLKNRKKDLKI